MIKAMILEALATMERVAVELGEEAHYSQDGQEVLVYRCIQRACNRTIDTLRRMS